MLGEVQRANLRRLGLIVTILVVAGRVVLGAVLAAKHHRKGRYVTQRHRGLLLSAGKAEDNRLVSAARNMRV